ncbi:FG-GAP repeat protein [Phytomonospora sp. NPDC050363]|uniref:FG-GAP repeat protein n=1 Tax=Phytomonospora sp. NPDC050363 TaxID=3155642 RepID=UPI0033ED163C
MNRRLLAGALACAITATGAILAAQPAAADPPESHVALPGGTYTDVTVDEARGKVFLAKTGPDAVVVTDLNGTLLQTITGITNPSELSLSEDGSTIYVTERETASFAAIDAESNAVTHHPLPAEHCVISAAYTGGKLWFSYRDGDCVTGGSLGSYDPATGEVGSALAETHANSVLRALPDQPDRLVRADTGETQGTLRVYDVTGETPTVVSTRTPLRLTACSRPTLFADGDKVALPCGGAGTRILSTADLQLIRTLPASSPPASMTATAATVSPDGRFIATGSRLVFGTGATASIWDAETGARVRDITSAGLTIAAGGLALTDGGELFLASSGENAVLSIFELATTYATRLTLSAPASVARNGTVNVTGNLQYGPSVPTALSVTRIGANGPRDLGTVMTDAQGVVNFHDTPGVLGRVLYRFSYTGDAEHTSVQTDVRVVIRGLPGDVNGDGYADTVVGAPGEDLGDDTDTGQIHLLYGSANGVTTTGNKAIHQDTTDVIGTNEDGDRFGHATAFGDFNGDGHADIAVAAPGENIGSTSNVGEIFVFQGSARGLLTTSVVGIYPAYHEAEWGFGSSLATGDFDGDGLDDLAVGAPGANVVYVYTGGDTGLVSARYSGLGDMSQNRRFGFSIDAGDINGDGLDDLAVGAVNDYDVKGSPIGSVTLFHGAARVPQKNQRLTKATAGVPGSAGSFNTSKGDSADQFGAQVALADFNGDGKDDLAVAAPGSAVTGTDGKRKADAGTVTVLYSDGTQIGTTGAVELTQKSAGLPGNPGAEDNWGATITAGDSNRDGRDELVVYGAGEDFITVVPGGVNGLVFSGARAWSQDSPGVLGGSETGDRWGASLRFADTKGNGHLSLIIGATGEDSGAGAITVMYSNANGITGTGAKFFSQDTDGIPGSEEKNDNFGAFF